MHPSIHFFSVSVYILGPEDKPSGESGCPCSAASGPQSRTTTLTLTGRDEPAEPGEADLPLLPLSFPLQGWSWVWARKLEVYGVQHDESSAQAGKDEGGVLKVKDGEE